MSVLYRKYRPQVFEDVLGQKHVIQTLKNQVASGQIAHAFLFTGTRGTGKTSIARILAKAVNCEKKSKTGDACGKCPVCKQIEQGNFMDLVEIDAASNTGVDNIRELIEHVKFSPTVGKYKIFIIDEVHMLSKGAFNALLKTLEEPPKHAIFVLATTEINKVPATIISRTQRFDFKRMAPEDLEKHLEKVVKDEKGKLPKAAIQLVAQNADGSVRDALTLLDKVLTLGDEASLQDCQQLLGITDLAVCENLLSLISQGKLAELPGFFDEMLERGQDFTIFNRDFLEYLRKLLVFKVTGGKIDFTLEVSHEKTMADLAGALAIPEIIFVIRLFLKSYKDIAVSPSPEIPLLLAALEGAMKKAVMPPVNQTVTPGRRSIEPAKTMPSPVEVKKTAMPEISSSITQAEIVEEEDDGGVSISMEEVQKKWPQAIEQIKKNNSPLATLIKNSPIQEVRGNKIVLGVKFLFHKQNLDNKKNQDLVHKVLEKIFDKKLSIRAAIVKEEAPASTVADTLTDALKVFGGEVVE